MFGLEDVGCRMLSEGYRMMNGVGDDVSVLSVIEDSGLSSCGTAALIISRQPPRAAKGEHLATTISIYLTKI